jgi:hypothetical protein
MVRLRALVGLKRRIEVLSLHGANRPDDIAIADIHDAR